jgi:uroporphyrinogen decarboxylase
LLAGGKALDSSVHKILDTLSSGPFIFNLGHGVLPQTPPENVERVVELIKNWNK